MAIDWSAAEAIHGMGEEGGLFLACAMAFKLFKEEVLVLVFLRSF